MRSIVVILYVVLILLSLMGKKINVFLFVFHLSIVPLISTVGFFSLNSFIGYILFMRFLFDKSKDIPKSLNRWHKSMNSFLVVTFIICVLNDLKNAWIMEGIIPSPLSHLLYAIDLIISVVCINYIAHLVFRDKQYGELVKNALLFSVLLLSISVFFTDAFYAMGLNISRKSVENVRSSGFYAGGDVNGLSGYYNIIVALILINVYQKKERIKLSSIFWLGLLAISIVTTASRMGIITLGVLFLIFILFQRHDVSNSLGSFLIIFLVIGVLYFSTSINQVAIERFQEQGILTEFDTDNTSSRSFLWQYYLKYSFSSTDTLLFGSSKRILDFSPHNFFIYSLFNNGIIVVCIYLVSLFGYFRSLLKELGFTSTLMLFLTLVISLMFLTSYLVVFSSVLVSIILLANTYNKKNHTIKSLENSTILS